MADTYAGVTLSRFWFPMATRIWNFEIRTKLVPNLGRKPIDSRSNNDVYRRPHDVTRTTHDDARTVHDDTRTTNEGFMKMQSFQKGLSEGHTKATR